MRLLRNSLVAVLATALALLSIGEAGAKPDDDGGVSPQIVGGVPASETYSFMVSLQNSSGSHFCGGSLIKPNWVVTAAHCADINPYQVRVGTRTWASGGSVARVVAKYNAPNSDVALLKLDQNVSQQPITIAADGGAQGTATRLIGWGSTTGEQGDRPSQLMQVDVQVTSGCTNQFNAQLELCLGGVSGKSACYGDSGGPAIRQVGGQWQLTGATSRAGQGRHPCQSNTAAIYGSVPAHKQWIDQVTGGTGPGPGPGPGCTLPAWRSGVNYPPNTQVSYQGNKWQSTYYTWGYPPGSPWGNWRNLGPC
ncbi:trypsin-like serine protease [Nocardioides speluncae]|uniref:trypsin-like serine protease n=1 Tax=Nocardioides speluncae TaxID=2670337 RepID=UPI000D696709|nr:trypsin-like serine protease [Nocardioides speluncae]